MPVTLGPDEAPLDLPAAVQFDAESPWIPPRRAYIRRRSWPGARNSPRRAFTRPICMIA